MIVHTQTKPEPGWINYDLFSAQWGQIIIYLSPSRIYMIYLPLLICISLYFVFATCCLIIEHKSHNTLYVPQCEIFSDSLVVISMWLFALRKNTRWYEGWILFYFLVNLLVPLGYLDWGHLGLSLDGLWGLNLDFQLAWCWGHLLDIHLNLQSDIAWLGDWHFIWHMVSIFGWSSTWHTGWLDDWHWRRIFGWVLTGNSTWIPTWICKYWSCAWFFVWTSDWHDTWHFSWKYFWITAWMYFSYKLVGSLVWRLVIPLTLQLDPFFCLQFTSHLGHW